MSHRLLKLTTCSRQVCKKRQLCCEAASRRKKICTPDRMTRHVIKTTVEQRFPFQNCFTFTFKGRELTAEQLIPLASEFLTDDRVTRIREIAANRTFTVLPIVEGLYDMGNLAAVCRSAEAMGFGAVHCIDSTPKYKQSARNSAGSEKWLHVQLWEDPKDCIKAVRAAGYRIVATHMRADSKSIQDIDWTQPTAVMLGNEREGISNTVLEAADDCAVIPMLGFVESFNVSVAASLVLYEAQQQRIRKLGKQGDLSPEEQEILQAVFMLRTQGRTKLWVEELLKRAPPQWQPKHFRREWEAGQHAVKELVDAVG